MFNKIFENVGERLGHISRAGVLAIAVGALLVIPNAALAKGKVQSDNWTEWFSEESGGESAICTTGIRTHQCDGKFCDNHAFRCYPANDNPAGVDAKNIRETGWYSEEGGYTAECGVGQVEVPASDGTMAIIETNTYTCTLDAGYPQYLPGDSAHLTSCVNRR